MNAIAPIPIDVYLLNGRNYVQATQMMARVCSAVDPVGAVLEQARFVRLTHHAVGIVPAGNDHADRVAIGSVRIRRGAESVEFRLVELPGLAPARKEPATIAIEQLCHDHALSGSYGFRSEATLEGTLDAVVQGIKQLHEALVPAAHDIWFTGLRSLLLPLQAAAHPGQGRVEVRRLRVLSDQGQYQSLMNVRLTISGRGQPLDGLVSFAYQSGGDHVD